MGEIKSTNINSLLKNDLKKTQYNIKMNNQSQPILSKVFEIERFDSKGYFTKTNKELCTKNNREYLSPLKVALDNRKSNEFTIKYDEEVGNRTYVKYMNMTYENLHKYGWKCNNHLYEIIPQGKSFKFYLDIDKEFINNENNEIVLNQVFEIMKEVFNFDINKSNYSLAYGKGLKEDKIKVSWHIIFEDIIIKNMDEGKRIINYLFQQITLNDKYHELRNGVLDIHPYSKNQAFKLPYQTKAFKNIKQEPENPKKDLSNFLLTNIESTNYFDISNIPLVEVKPYTYKSKSGKQIKVNFNEGEMIKEYKSCFPKQFKLLPIDTKLNTNELPYYLKSIPNNEKVSRRLFLTIGWCISNITKNSEEGLKLWSEWTSQYKPTSVEELRSMYYSNSTTFGYKWTMITNLASIFNNKIGSGGGIIKPLFDDTPTYNCEIININSRYNGNSMDIKKIIKKYDIINIKAPMGCGKSHDLKQVFSDPFASVCYISCKRAFASSMIHTFKKFGFKNYMDFDNKNDIKNENRIICSIESIQYCRDSYDYLIIDESESICDNLGGQMFRKNKPIEGSVKLHDLILRTKKILVMDAYLTRRSFDFIKDIFNSNIEKKKCVYIKNSYKYPVRKFVRHKIKENFYKKIGSLLLEGKRCAICCGSKNMARKILRYLEENDIDKNKTILSYNNENPLQNGIDLNEAWSKCDLVLYTPTITAGISYDNKDYPFDNLFLYAVNKNSCHFRDMIQAHKRIRFFTSNIINIFISDGWDFTEEQKPFRIETIQENNDFKSLLFDSEEEVKSFKDIGKLKYLYNIHIFNTLEKNISDKFLSSLAYKYLYEENIINMDFEEELEGEVNDGDFDDDWTYDNIKNISPMKRDEIKSIMDKRNEERITQDEKKQLVKFNYTFDHIKEETDIIVQKHFFNSFYSEKDERDRNQSVREFKKMLNDINYEFNAFNKWRDEKGKGTEIYCNKPLELYDMKYKRYEHIMNFLNGLGFLNKGVFDINTQFFGCDFDQFQDYYKGLDRFSLNQMLDDPTIRIETEGQLKSAQIKGIFNQLLRAEFGMEVMGTGKFSQKKINGKKKKRTIMCIRNYIHKDKLEEVKTRIRSEKFNKFNVYKDTFNNEEEVDFIDEDFKEVIIQEQQEEEQQKLGSFSFKKEKKTENYSGQNISINNCNICGKNCFNTLCMSCMTKSLDNGLKCC